MHEQAVVERTPVGTPIKMCGVVQDVTELRTAIAASERRAAELTKALELEELRTSLINAVSHDLRQPITSIVGYCEVLIDELHGPLNELQNRDLNLILRSAGRLKAMVDDLLDAARIQAGTFRANLEPGDLAPVAQAVVEAFQPMADLEGVKLSSAIDGDLPWPAIDPGQIERVFSNLVHNALKFTPPPGTVSVRLYPDEGGVVFEVRDSGPGIAQDDIPKLFQRFSQVGRGPRLEGAGLGLSICKAIVEAHHGRIGVESEAGLGARFWVWLPVAPSSRTS